MKSNIKAGKYGTRRRGIQVYVVPLITQRVTPCLSSTVCTYIKERKERVKREWEVSVLVEKEWGFKRHQIIGSETGKQQRENGKRATEEKREDTTPPCHARKVFMCAQGIPREESKKTV
jgi:hypothetical protein